MKNNSLHTVNASISVKKPLTKAMRTRAHILKSALSVMEAKGYANTTIRDICKAADVSIGTFYSYFPTKSDIFFDIYKNGDDYFYNTVADQLDKSAKAPEKLVEFFRQYARLNEQTGIEITKILYNPENSWFTRNRPMQVVLEKIVRTGQENGELRLDTTAEDTVHYLFTIARGCCYNWCIHNGDFDLEEKMEQYISLAVRSIKTE